MINEKLEQVSDIVNCSLERGISMIRILICDDDALFLNKLHTEIEVLLDNKTIKSKIHTYDDIDTIGDPILASCDIAFLDVDFNQKNYTGMDIARKLRNVRPNAIIIFVTNYITYAPEGYEVQAFRYVLKSEIHDKLDSCLRMAIEKLETIRETIKIQVYGEIIDLALDDILYIEAQLHMVLIHVQKDKHGKKIKQYCCYNAIGNLEKQLELRGFLRIHKSFLVNMRHIKKYQCHEVVLTNNTILRASDKYYREQKNKYLLWKGWR